MGQAEDNKESSSDIRRVAEHWLKDHGLRDCVDIRAVEYDYRKGVWRCVLVPPGRATNIGNICVLGDCLEVSESLSSDPDIIRDRSLSEIGKHERESRSSCSVGRRIDRSLVILGDAMESLDRIADDSVDLVFTSPPYFNAKEEYSGYVDYEQYLSKMQDVFRACHRVLFEGRFIVVNVSPVIIPRISASSSSKRIPIPFDFHRILNEEGFDFIDDIVWKKPDGAGWATGRGRMFARTRKPLQYKANPVTEYVLVYRKRTHRTISWNTSRYEDDIVGASLVGDEYEKTNVWNISTARDEVHPAVFPVALAERVVRYYSFVGDVVLDPFAGVGTTGIACSRLDRRFVLVDRERRYVNELVDRLNDSGIVGWEFVDIG